MSTRITSGDPNLARALVTAVCSIHCNKTSRFLHKNLGKQAQIARQYSPFFCNGYCTYLSPELWRGLLGTVFSLIEAIPIEKRSPTLLTGMLTTLVALHHLHCPSSMNREKPSTSRRGSGASQQRCLSARLGLIGKTNAFLYVSLLAHFPPRRPRQSASTVARRLRNMDERSKDQTLSLAGWLLIISTLDPREWSTEQVICLYQARWQIELLIKRIKQLLQVHRLPNATASFNRSMVACLLLAWILQEQDARQLQILVDPLPLLTEQASIVGLPTPRPPSQWLLNAVC